MVHLHWHPLSVLWSPVQAGLECYRPSPAPPPAKAEPMEAKSEEMQTFLKAFLGLRRQLSPAATEPVAPVKAEPVAPVARGQPEWF